MGSSSNSTANQANSLHSNNPHLSSSSSQNTTIASDSTSTPPTKPSLQNLTRNAFIANKATPPTRPGAPEIQIQEPTSSTIMTSSMSYSPSDSTLKNSTILNSTLV